MLQYAVHENELYAAVCGALPKLSARGSSLPSDYAGLCQPRALGGRDLDPENVGRSGGLAADFIERVTLRALRCHKTRCAHHASTSP
jgi:hypothetical protein